jgi:hypothetical protein
MKNIGVMSAVSGMALTAITVAYLHGPVASAASSCGTKAECACSTALNVGTRSALTSFMRQYPHADTACNALASTDDFGALTQRSSNTGPFGGGNAPSGNGPGSGGNGGSDPGGGGNGGNGDDGHGGGDHGGHDHGGHDHHGDHKKDHHHDHEGQNHEGGDDNHLGGIK